jgi:hypothetical protein
MVLTVTGVYLWLIPLLRRRQAQAASKKAKEALAAKQALNVVPTVPLQKSPERELVGATKD